MKHLNRAIGSDGEDIAREYLLKEGYEILEVNFRSKFGEIDIIGKDKSYITFIEVKTRYNLSFGIPSESVNFRKQLKIIKTAQIFILRNQLSEFDIRFDIVEVYLNTTDNSKEVKILKNAFQT